METPYHKMELKFAGIDMLQDHQHYAEGTGWGSIPIPAVTNHRKVGLDSVEQSKGLISSDDGSKPKTLVAHASCGVGSHVTMTEVDTARATQTRKTELDDLETGGEAFEEEADKVTKGLSAMSTSVHTSHQAVDKGSSGRRRYSSQDKHVDKSRCTEVTKVIADDMKTKNKDLRDMTKEGHAQVTNRSGASIADDMAHKEDFVSPAVTTRDKVKRYMYVLYPISYTVMRGYLHLFVIAFRRARQASGIVPRCWEWKEVM